MKPNLLRSAALIVPLLITTGAFAQQAAMAPAGATAAAPASTMAPAAPTPSGTADLSKADKEFVTKAAHGGIAEVQLAELAQKKTSDAGVKQFAQTMIDDHTPNNAKLAELATAKGLTAPTEPSAAQQKAMAKLEGLDGTKFDHAYLSQQLKAHETMLKLFQHEAKDGKDADLKAFAESTAPVIQKHITMAQSTK